MVELESSRQAGIGRLPFPGNVPTRERQPPACVLEGFNSSALLGRPVAPERPIPQPGCMIDHLAETEVKRRDEPTLAGS